MELISASGRSVLSGEKDSEMKKSLLLLVFLWLLCAAAPVPAGTRISDDGTCRGIRLWGRVKVVQAFPDLKVQVVGSFPDLRVQMVESFPNSLGKWQFVEYLPDFTIQFVNSFPDLKIQFVNSFPGRP